MQEAALRSVVGVHSADEDPRGHSGDDHFHLIGGQSGPALLASAVASGPMSHRRMPRAPLARRPSSHALSLAFLKLALVITSPHYYAPAGAVIAMPMVTVYVYARRRAARSVARASRHHCKRLLYVTAAVS